ncbi:hypothetical protein [Flavobacterium sp. NKUCC04_CG]|uniref:hypothetical protein n=1 Tax=Flavobacterium sp. NKUCC04_CG TaxID=2842121 RepID=UPI001C5BE6AC|nr:hypothetical protein [Flavobacterium sp. NKUCC04_CG]MBW3519530.1 hypothetical protein [Flavobacterium sp. NKUCC04_CG]
MKNTIAKLQDGKRNPRRDYYYWELLYAIDDDLKIEESFKNKALLESFRDDIKKIGWAFHNLRRVDRSKLFDFECLCNTYAYIIC